MKGIVSRHMHRRRARAKTSTAGESLALRILDKAAIVSGVIGPLMTLPQIWQIYRFHMASGVSAISWIAFGTLDLPFILYGVAHRSRLIFITYVLWCIVNFAVAIGAIAYGSHVQLYIPPIAQSQ